MVTSEMTSTPRLAGASVHTHWGCPGTVTWRVMMATALGAVGAACEHRRKRWLPTSTSACEWPWSVCLPYLRSRNVSNVTMSQTSQSSRLQRQNISNVTVSPK
eukprot:1855877-Rhodomonas_salina.2